MNDLPSLILRTAWLAACVGLFVAWVSAAQPRNSPFAGFSSGPVIIAIPECGIESMTVLRRDGDWLVPEVNPPVTVDSTASDVRSQLDASLAVLRIRFTEHGERGVLRIWFAGPDGEAGLARPFFAELRAEDLLVQDWNIRMRRGGDAEAEPDRDRVALWVHKHADKITDASFLAAVSDHIWHHQDLDDPPGSFNRIIDLNKRIIELRPHDGDAYSTTAWLLWSKWVTWKQNPTRMPDGKNKLKEALKLLKQGEKQNAGKADFLFQAGTVLMPVARHHRPELAERVESYLRRAAEAAEDGPLAVPTRRTLASHYFTAGDMERARIWYRKLLDVDPDNVLAKKRLEEIRTGAAEGGGRPRPDADD